MDFINDDSVEELSKKTKSKSSKSELKTNFNFLKTLLMANQETYSDDDVEEVEEVEEEGPTTSVISFKRKGRKKPMPNLAIEKRVKRSVNKPKETSVVYLNENSNTSTESIGAIEKRELEAGNGNQNANNSNKNRVSFNCVF
jgi:hypothetical protein